MEDEGCVVGANVMAPLDALRELVEALGAILENGGDPSDHCIEELRNQARLLERVRRRQRRLGLECIENLKVRGVFIYW